MEAKSKTTYIEEIFSEIEDWRVDRCKSHKLVDILFLSLSAMLSGAEAFTEIEDFGYERLEWLRKYVDLSNGIPSHDTIRRIFLEMDPSRFESCFNRFISELYNPMDGDLIVLDGKQLRGSKSVGEGSYGFYLVNAWAHRQGLCLGQKKVSSKDNEITVLPEILDMLDLEARIVSIDAMGTQRAIAEQIIDQGGDYLLALKENQGTLYEEAVNFFEHEAESDFTFVQVNQDDAWDKGHGRVERRLCQVAYDVQSLRNYPKWKGLSAIVKLQASRWLGDKEQQETRYYITSLSTDAQHINACIRSHWGIENSLHWVLDVVFHEDAARIRTENAPQNMALLRKLSINLIKANRGKYSIKAARLKAAWNTKVLEQLIFGKNYNA